MPNAVENASTRRIALCVEYDGKNYCGWQRQKNAESVQGILEDTVSGIANQPITLHCAGRTDTGVHASGQILHFNYTVDEQRPRQLKAWVEGCNTRLPADISVRWAKIVSADFHARFSAISRRYRYIIHNSRARSALLANRVSRVEAALDVTLMQQCLTFFIGEKDFSAVRAAHCQSKSCFRDIHSLTVVRRGDYIIIEVSANAFLYHMVRNIAGILIAVGKTSLKPLDVKVLLEGKDRTQAPATASASGLYLVAVNYPAKFELPLHEPGPLPWQAD